MKMPSVVLAALSLSSCAIHPLPEDVTPYKTSDIVNHIRCEAKDALQSRLIEYLESVDDGDPAAVKFNNELAARLRAGTLRFPEFARSYLDKLAPSTSKTIKKYQESAIAYEFNFDMKETTNASASLNFIDVFSSGTRKLGAGADNERSRQNVRNFRLVDTMKALVLDEKYCSDVFQEKNYVYPIIGSVGLKETIATFFDLNERVRFASHKDEVPDLGDTLTFTTTLKASATPSILLNGVTPFRLANANLSIDASRTDIHKLIIGISAQTKAPPAPARKVPLPGFAAQRRVHADHSMTEQNALRVLDEQKLNNFLNSNILVPR